MEYDPTWLVEALRSQGESADLLRAADACRKIHSETKAYIYFVDPENPNTPGAVWQFAENVVVETTPHGEVVLDVLTGNRIGGIEFLERVPGW